MEIELIKYFIFVFSSVILMGGLKLWLKKNKEKRKKIEEKNLEN